MSTNYYWFSRPICIHCGVAAKPVHIGLSACGWAFQLHIYPVKRNPDNPDEYKIESFEDWNELFMVDGSYIEDEYQRVIPIKDMIALILDTEAKNHAPLDDHRCVARTVAYDLIRDWEL